MLTDLMLGAEHQRLFHDVAEQAAARLDGLVGTPSGFTAEQWQACADVGIQGLPVPVEFGGRAADAPTIATTMEALGYACTDNGLLFSLGAHLWSAVAPLVRFGTPAQQQHWLPGLADGSLVGVQGMTEPDTGSDAFALRTLAKVGDDDVVLAGSKTFITNAAKADVFVVFATTDPAKGWAGLSAFLVPSGTPGLTVGAPFRKLGISSSPLSELFFDQCRIPRDNAIGKPGTGMMVFTHSMDWERRFIMGPALGVMRRHLERSARLVAGARAAPLGRLAAERLGAIAVRLSAARLQYHHAARTPVRGAVKPAGAAMLKLLLSETWTWCTHEQLALRSMLGAEADPELDNDLCDAVASRIYSGTSEIQRDIIGQALKL